METMDFILKELLVSALIRQNHQFIDLIFDVGLDMTKVDHGMLESLYSKAEHCYKHRPSPTNSNKRPDDRRTLLVSNNIFDLTLFPSIFKILYQFLLYRSQYNVHRWKPLKSILIEQMAFLLSRKMFSICITFILTVYTYTLNDVLL